MSSIRNTGIGGVTRPTKACSDIKCPYHGKVGVRGMLFDSRIIQVRAPTMAVAEREYTFFSKKYQRYERRRSRIHAHLAPCLEVKEGDEVLVGETRPLSKSVSFVVLGRRE